MAGFEPLDILEGTRLILTQIAPGKAEVGNEYHRVVTWEGNLKAQELMDRVFEKQDSIWRGIGKIPQSGLKIRKGYSLLDAEERFPVAVRELEEHPGCICGDILRGLKSPLECSLFSRTCRPAHPIGACMVSEEGTCAAYFKYGNKEMLI